VVDIRWFVSHMTLPHIYLSSGGGTLSIKKHPSGQYDIFFTYSDRIAEISAADFCNIMPNFIETAAKLKERFLTGSGGDRQGTSSSTAADSSMQSSSQAAENAQVGLAAKFV